MCISGLFGGGVKKNIKQTKKIPNADQTTTAGDKALFETAFANMVTINTNIKVDMKAIFKGMQVDQLETTFAYIKHDRTNVEKKLLKLTDLVAQIQNLKQIKATIKNKNN